MQLPCEVLQFAGAIFATPSTTEISSHTSVLSSNNSFLVADQLNESGSFDVDSQQPTGLLESPRTEPIALNGRYITLDGPASIEIFDELGNRIGSVNDSGGYEVSIPGANFYQLGSNTSIFLPDSGLYEIKIYGEQETATDIRIQKFELDQLTQTTLYDDLPLTINSIASLNYNPVASVPNMFELDQDGDGTTEINFPYTEILDSVESQDFESPKTTITINGTPSLDGWYIGEATVTINATDNVGGTGVAKIEYSTDGGTTVQTYSGPFTINADEIKSIFAKATDRAGNEESPLSFVGSLQVYLPTIIK